MQLRLTTSIGINDAKRFGLDYEYATEGETIDVEPAAAEELVKRGWAVDPAVDKLKADPAKAKKLEAVPPAGKP